MSTKFEAPIIKTVPGKYDEENIILEIEKNSANPAYIINQEEISSDDYYLKNIPSLFVPVCAVHDTDSTNVYILLSNYEFILLDTSTMKTTKLANPPVNYKQCSMIIEGSLIYIFGGITSASAGAGTTAIYAYNKSTEAWTSSLGTLTRAVKVPTLAIMYYGTTIYSASSDILVYGGTFTGPSEYRGQVFNTFTKTITDSHNTVIEHYSRYGTSIRIPKSNITTKPFELMISGEFSRIQKMNSVILPQYLDVHGTINNSVPSTTNHYNDDDLTVYANEVDKVYAETGIMKFDYISYDGKIFAFGPEAKTQMIIEVDDSDLSCDCTIEALEPLYSGVFPVTINYTDPYVLCIPLYTGNKLYKINFKKPTIVYTSDGSDPDTSNTAKVYTDKTSVPLSKATQIKAITKIV